MSSSSSKFLLLPPRDDGALDGCPGCVPNEHGTMNRLLVVAELPTGAMPAVGQRL